MEVLRSCSELLTLAGHGSLEPAGRTEQFNTTRPDVMSHIAPCFDKAGA